MSQPPRPAHFKAVWDADGAHTGYACVQHESQLRTQAENVARVESVPPSERDRAGVWCSYCNAGQS